MIATNQAFNGKQYRSSVKTHPYVKWGKMECIFVEIHEAVELFQKQTLLVVNMYRICTTLDKCVDFVNTIYSTFHDSNPPRLQ